MTVEAKKASVPAATPEPEPKQVPSEQQPPPPPPKGDNQQPPPPARSSHDTHKDKFSIPGSQDTRPPLLPCFTLDFFSPRSLHPTKTITVNPHYLTNFVGRIYDQQEQLCHNALPIERGHYIRMIKTLVLKRVQDVHEKCFNARAPHFVRLYRNIIVPKPIYDLMCAIGRGFNVHDGYHYYMSPVAQPNANPPNWWAIDHDILTNYQQFSRRMSPLYMHVEFPSTNDYDGRFIGCTRLQEDHGRTSVLASTPAPTPADGLLRIMNPDGFFGGDVPAVETCSYRLCDETVVAPVMNAFIGSAVLASNS